VSGIPRVIFDTSTLVSAAHRTGSVPDQALTKAMRTCDMCASAETLAELAQVLGCEKFNRYRDRQSRLSFVSLIHRTARLFSVQDADLAVVDPPCRDPRDNQFLALALVSEADILVSSDDDLLVLHPWRGVRIVTPAEFLG
jgi:putative PIN family toxin of toxin-antitoxin system